MTEYISRESLLTRIDAHRSKLQRIATRLDRGRRRMLRGDGRELLDEQMRLARSVLGPVERPETAEALLLARIQGLRDAARLVERSRARRER